MDLQQSKSPVCIGLIADTHGSAELLSRAIETLLHNGADCLVHLGDFCDSLNHGELRQVFSLLQRYRVRTVKGNNDFQVEKMLQHGELRQYADKQEQWLAFLQQTPVVMRLGDICFCHSLPYESIRAFYEPVDTGSTERAAEVFDHVADYVIFCGHSHDPVLFRSRNRVVTREQMHGQSTVLHCHQRYIIIVGAGENSECALFDINRSRYERILIPAPSRMEQADERAELRF
ncbi:MAG: metallophosphoesterase family protein [Desulfobacterales bacterium]